MTGGVRPSAAATGRPRDWAALGRKSGWAAGLVVGCGSGWAKKGKEEEGFKRKGFHFQTHFKQ
jgi:hypothetical protein